MKALKVLFAVTMLLAIGLVALPQQLNNDAQAQQRVRESLRALHREAKSLPDTSHPIDPRLNRVLERALSDTLRSSLQANQPKTLRELLREEMIYDYQVHLLSIPVESLSAKAIGRALNDHATLRGFMNNQYIHRQGIAIQGADGEYIIHLLLTEHYIDITETVWSGAQLPGNTTVYKVIVMGWSYTDKVSFRYKEQLKELDYKGEVRLDGARLFQIIIPEQFKFGIEFFDTTGRTIAVY